MALKNVIPFRKEVLKIIKNHLSEKKFDSATLIKIHSMSYKREDRIRAGKLALLARAVAKRMRFGESAKAAFFGGIMYHSKLLNAYRGGSKESGEVKEIVSYFFKICQEGNTFIAHCVCIDRFIKEKTPKLSLTAKDFSCNALEARKFSKITKIIGKIIKVSDRVINAKKTGTVDVKKLKEEFPGEHKLIGIAMEEARKLFEKRNKPKKRR